MQCQGPALTGMTAEALTIMTLSPLKLTILSRSIGLSWSNSPRAIGSREILGPWGAQQMEALEVAARSHYQPQPGGSDVA